MYHRFNHFLLVNPLKCSPSNNSQTVFQPAGSKSREGEIKVNLATYIQSLLDFWKNAYIPTFSFYLQKEILASWYAKWIVLLILIAWLYISCFGVLQIIELNYHRRITSWFKIECHNTRERETRQFCKASIFKTY